MTPQTKRFVEIAALLAVAFIGAYFYASTFEAGHQIFITDSYFISPNSQPLHYAAFIIVNLVILAGAAFLGFLLVGVLLARGLLIKTGGAIMLTAAFVLAVVWFGLGDVGEGLADIVFSGLIVLILAVFGALMIFGVPGRKATRM